MNQIKDAIATATAVFEMFEIQSFICYNNFSTRFQLEYYYQEIN